MSIDDNIFSYVFKTNYLYIFNANFYDFYCIKYDIFRYFLVRNKPLSSYNVE